MTTSLVFETNGMRSAFFWYSGYERIRLLNNLDVLIARVRQNLAEYPLLVPNSPQERLVYNSQFLLLRDSIDIVRQAIAHHEQRLEESTASLCFLMRIVARIAQFAVFFFWGAFGYRRRLDTFQEEVAVFIRNTVVPFQVGTTRLPFEIESKIHMRNVEVNVIIGGYEHGVADGTLGIVLNDNQDPEACSQISFAADEEDSILKAYLLNYQNEMSLRRLIQIGMELVHQERFVTLKVSTEIAAATEILQRMGFALLNGEWVFQRGELNPLRQILQVEPESLTRFI